MDTLRRRLPSLIRESRRSIYSSHETSEDERNHLVERVRRKNKTAEIDIPVDDITFLHEVGILKDLKCSFPNVDVNKECAKICLKLKGYGEEFDCAYEQYRSQQHRINRSSYGIEDPTIWNLIADGRGKEHIKAMLSWKNIKAQVC